MNTRETYGANVRSRALHHAQHGGNVQRNLKTFPDSLHAASFPLKRSKLRQAMLDILALFFFTLFLSVTAVSLPVAVFLLFFCRF
jgi:hypothetical protein